MPSRRYHDRLSMGVGAILPLAVAAALLPLADSEATDWLRGKGLVREIAGRRCVIWADVIDALRHGDDVETVALRASLPRVRL